MRTYLLPDLDDELVETLRQVEELLLTECVNPSWPRPDGRKIPTRGPFVLPASLAGRVVLDALNRVQDPDDPDPHPPQRVRALAAAQRHRSCPGNRDRTAPASAAAVTARPQVLSACPERRPAAPPHLDAASPARLEVGVTWDRPDPPVRH